MLWMLTRAPRLEQPFIEPSTLKIIIDSEEIIHRKRSTIAFEEQGHKPPEESTSEYALTFLWRN